MTPTEFFDSTPRLVAVFIDADLKRRDEAGRLTISGAWHSAAFERQSPLLPLSHFLSTDAPEPQSPLVQRRILQAMAAQFGELKVHDTPVVSAEELATMRRNFG
jgi:hypothetical protein